MAVAVDATSSSSGSDVASIAWTHTPVGTPSSVGVAVAGYANATGTISGVTYGSTNLAQAVLSAADIQGDRASIWGAGSPVTGAQTVTVTFGATHWYPQTSAVTVTGSDTSTIFSNSTTATGGAGNPLTTTVTSAVGEIVIDAFVADPTGDVATCGQTQIAQNQIGGERAGVSYASGASPSVGMTWTGIGGTPPYAHAVASFKAASADTLMGQAVF